MKFSNFPQNVSKNNVDTMETIIELLFRMVRWDSSKIFCKNNNFCKNLYIFRWGGRGSILAAEWAPRQISDKFLCGHLRKSLGKLLMLYFSQSHIAGKFYGQKTGSQIWKKGQIFLFFDKFDPVILYKCFFLKFIGIQINMCTVLNGLNIMMYK